MSYCQRLRSSEQHRRTPQSTDLCCHCCVHGVASSSSHPSCFTTLHLFFFFLRCVHLHEAVEEFVLPTKGLAVLVLPFIDVVIKQTFSFTCYSHLLLPEYCTRGTVCMSHCSVTTIVLVSSPLLEWEVGFVYYSCNSLLLVFSALST